MINFSISTNESCNLKKMDVRNHFRLGVGEGLLFSVCIRVSWSLWYLDTARRHVLL